MSTQFEFEFTDQVVLVAGASGSLGTATVEHFHDAGATVCMSARNPPKDGKAATLLDEDRVQFYDADFTDEAAVASVFESLLEDHGRLDALCSLVGSWRGGTPIDETGVDEFDFLLDVNLKTMFLAAKHAIPHLRASEGTLVTVSSRSSLGGGEGDGPYRAAKAGVRLLTETIAAENRGSVRANAIMPSIIDTPANRELLPDAAHQKWPTPDEIARTILFLCSDAASATSGAAVPVYGES
ncbi:glucose 1-dehydrogenase/short-chain dehydrogenase/reductase SDR [Natrialba chahannaoensis JCM 10990]|uniref:Glucose 1-dehydrogenase/short-chain dehydrogenase/reductase SDR n=1 Tax=Natrialba chahannaoensis JCM 10990 TaxID=1227492 RepID=M0AQT1_9EURY|nr:SDR family oxidoreductase [Natrialba chahannaoensis]ELY99743.1 glucose 1-dehydrogenase/short-chain dehydrogenase/reductase SDR [Natrialba chahannaoensis JCM 10990]